MEQALATGVRIFDLNRPATQRGIPGTIVRTVDEEGTRYPLVEVAAASDSPQGPGTFAMWDLPAFRVRDRRLSGRAIDDLAGAAVALCVLDSLVRQQASVRLGVLLTRAEEVGFVGMLAALDAGFLPRHALYINIECSSVAAGAVLGAGPILRVGDRLWVFDPDISGGMAALADELASQQPPFRYQRKLMDSGACEATPLMQADYRTGAVALPLGNYHNSGPDVQLAPEYIHPRRCQRAGAPPRLRGPARHWHRAGTFGRHARLHARRPPSAIPRLPPPCVEAASTPPLLSY